MNKENSTFKLFALNVCLPLTFALALPSNSHAEIYKWKDANGQTHYSENKDDAGRSKAEEMKISSKPAQENAPSATNWQEREQEFKQRLVQKQLEQSSRPPVASRPRANQDRSQAETDASRCDLARKIISGAVQHGNGAKTDTNDRMIAERDISTYCR